MPQTMTKPLWGGVLAARRREQLEREEVNTHADMDDTTRRALQLAQLIESSDDDAVPVPRSDTDDDSLVHHLEELRARITG